MYAWWGGLAQVGVRSGSEVNFLFHLLRSLLFCIQAGVATGSGGDGGVGGAGDLRPVWTPKQQHNPEDWAPHPRRLQGALEHL